MSHLCVYHQSNCWQPVRLLNHFDDIVRELESIGVHYQRWPFTGRLEAGATDADMLALFADDIAAVQQAQGLGHVDVMRMHALHPEVERQRRACLSEHSHSGDEIRFFVRGRGQYGLAVDGHVYSLFCERGDLVRIPAGMPHWFDMGERPEFVCIRLYADAQALQLQPTGSDLASRYPQLQD